MRVLDEHLSEERLAGEWTFYAGPGGRVAERPYGWAWLVMLHGECRRVAGSQARPLAGQCRRALGHRSGTARYAPPRPLGGLLLFSGSPLPSAPARTGTRRSRCNCSIKPLGPPGTPSWPMRSRAQAGIGSGRTPPLPWSAPPSGSDFLDPSLVEAAFMADVLAADEYRDWIAQVCPAGVVPDWSPARFTPDGADPYTVHLEGLHVSRAWCLDRVGRALGPDSPLGSAALSGRDNHLEVVTKIDPFDGFNRAHWLPTYLVYLEGWLTNSL